MPYAAGLEDAQLTDVNKNPVKSLIKRNIQRFSDDAVWYDLGKVVAVDVFNGNNDRFDIATGKWMNYGNIMFLAHGTTRVVGLDMFDPNGDYSNYNRAGGFPELLVLNDDIARNHFARLCVISVGTTMKRELGGNKPIKQGGFATITILLNGNVTQLSINTMQDLFLPYVLDFARGLADGSATLKRYLLSKAQQYAVENRALPVGVVDRMNYLDWVPGPARQGRNAPMLTPQQMLARPRYNRPRNLGGGGT
jgi:hypothetical protein